MANISFNEEQVAARSVPIARDPLFVRLLISWGIAKTRRGAELVLILIIIASVALIIFLFPKGRGEPELDVPMAGPGQQRVR